MIPENLISDPAVAALEEFATAVKFEFGETTVEVAPENILAALRRLKELKFERLTSVTGVDRFPAEPRFEVVYHLQSVAGRKRIRIKTRLYGSGAEIESATSVYRSADWYERETFDFFGIVFRNHPRLTRIMMPDDWEGHPLRKDYPVTGTRY